MLFDDVIRAYGSRYMVVVLTLEVWKINRNGKPVLINWTEANEIGREEVEDDDSEGEEEESEGDEDNETHAEKEHE